MRSRPNTLLHLSALTNVLFSKPRILLIPPQLNEFGWILKQHSHTWLVGRNLFCYKQQHITSKIPYNNTNIICLQCATDKRVQLDLKICIIRCWPCECVGMSLVFRNCWWACHSLTYSGHALSLIGSGAVAVGKSFTSPHGLVLIYPRKPKPSKRIRRWEKVHLQAAPCTVTVNVTLLCCVSHSRLNL